MAGSDDWLELPEQGRNTVTEDEKKVPMLLSVWRASGVCPSEWHFWSTPQTPEQCVASRRWLGNECPCVNGQGGNIRPTISIGGIQHKCIRFASAVHNCMECHRASRDQGGLKVLYLTCDGAGQNRKYLRCTETQQSTTQKSLCTFAWIYTPMMTTERYILFRIHPIYWKLRATASPTLIATNWAVTFGTMDTKYHGFT